MEQVQSPTKGTILLQRAAGELEPPSDAGACHAMPCVLLYFAECDTAKCVAGRKNEGEAEGNAIANGDVINFDTPAGALHAMRCTQ